MFVNLWKNYCTDAKAKNNSIALQICDLKVLNIIIYD